jgi:hypothetical protein
LHFCTTHFLTKKNIEKGFVPFQCLSLLAKKLSDSYPNELFLKFSREQIEVANTSYAV